MEEDTYEKLSKIEQADRDVIEEDDYTGHFRITNEDRRAKLREIEVMVMANFVLNLYLNTQLVLIIINISQYSISVNNYY